MGTEGPSQYSPNVPLEDDVGSCVVAGLAADEADPSELPKRTTSGSLVL